MQLATAPRPPHPLSDGASRRSSSMCIFVRRRGAPYFPLYADAARLVRANDQKLLAMSIRSPEQCPPTPESWAEDRTRSPAPLHRGIPGSPRGIPRETDLRQGAAASSSSHATDARTTPVLAGRACIAHAVPFVSYSNLCRVHSADTQRRPAGTSLPSASPHLRQAPSASIVGPTKLLRNTRDACPGCPARP